MSANSVLPPADGTMRADSSEYFADTLERGIRMPQLVAEIERAPAVVARQQVALLIEIGNVAHLDAEPALIEPRHVVGGVELDFAERFGERDLLVVGQRLIVEQQYGMAVHGGMDVRRRSGIERCAQIDAGDLGDELVPDRDEPHGCLLARAIITRLTRRRHGEANCWG